MNVFVSGQGVGIVVWGTILIFRWFWVLVHLLVGVGGGNWEMLAAKGGCRMGLYRSFGVCVEEGKTCMNRVLKGFFI